MVMTLDQLATIPAKISSETPLPMPLDSIWLPIQVTSWLPAVKHSTMTMAVKMPPKPVVYSSAPIRRRMK